MIRKIGLTIFGLLALAATVYFCFFEAKLPYDLPKEKIVANDNYSALAVPDDTSWDDDDDDEFEF